MEQQLTPKQAFELISQVAVQFRGTRQEHELIERALKVIAPLVESGRPDQGGGA